MQFISFTCPHCGASLPPRAPTGDVRCDYCGNVFHATRPRAARTQHGVDLDPRQLRRAVAEAQREAQQEARDKRRRAARQARRAGGDARRRSRAGAWAGRALILFTLALSFGIPVATGQFEFCTQSVKQIAAVTGITDRIGWNSNGGPPVLATIAGAEAFVGRTRVYSADDQLYIDAHDSRTLERRWRIGPLGTYSEAYSTSHFAVLGDRVIVVDSRAELSIHDLQSGEELHRRPLTDHVAYLCEPPRDDPGKGADSPPARVFLILRDNRNQFVDPLTGAGEEGRKPAWCKRRSRARRFRQQARSPVKKVPRADGFRARHAYAAGDIAVAAGVKHPGTEVPRALGWDPGTRELRWQVDVASVDMTSVRPGSAEWDALVGHRYISTYGTGQDYWHLTALDARTGDRLWDTQLRSLLSVDRLYGLVASDHFVYVVRTSSLEVFDAATGQLVGTLGDEIYD